METNLEPAPPKNKMLLKGLVIGGLVLLLLIPTFFVQNLIWEREQRQKDAITEVSSRWAGSQNLAGPVLVIPYIKSVADAKGKVGHYRHFAYFMPDELRINTTVTPQERSRGIYKVILYKTKATISGRFGAPNFGQLKIAQDKILWNEAYVKMAISDVKGLNDELKLAWNDSTLTLTAQSLPDPAAEGMAAALPSITTNSAFTFSTTIDLNGSEQLLFTPAGKVTYVQVASQWPHPSFTGNTLPDASNISDSGFTASWKSLSHKRAFPQYWTSETAHARATSGISIDEQMRQASLASTCLSR